MDDEVIRILIEIKQFSQSVRQIRQIAKEINNLSNAQAGYNKAAKQAKQTQQSFNSSMRTSFNARGMQQAHAAMAASGRPGRYAPVALLHQQQARLRLAQMSGDPMRIFDAQYGVARAQQRVAQARNYSNPMSIMARNIQNATSPAQQLMGAIGSIANPVMALVGAVIAAVAAVGLMAKAAIEAGVALARIGITSGSGTTDTARLSVLGSAMGVDMGQLAREFAADISKGGEAGGFASRAGIHDFGTFDTTDKGRKLLDWMKYLDKLNPTEAMRAARVTHTEALLPYRNLSDKTKQNLEFDAQRKKHIMNPEFQRQSLEAMVAFGRIGDAITNLVASVLKPMMPEFLKWTDEFIAGLQSIAKFIEEHQDFFKGIAEIIHGILTFDIDKITQGVKDTADAIKGDKGISGHVDALDRNTRAVESNTDSWATRNGTYGGGERARGAVPSKWSGMNTERYIGEARRLGAFAL